MKRALLIFGGTVGGLGAVLSVTPPQIGVAHGGVSSLAAGSTSPVGSDVATQASPSADPQTAAPTQTPASPTSSGAPAAASPAASASSPSASKPTPTAHATKTAQSIPKATPSPTQSTPAASTSATPTPTPTPTKTPTPTPTPTKTTATPTPVASGVSGSFTGATFDALEGNRNLWGRMTVTVTLKDGVISNISASQNPSSRSYNAISYLTSTVLTQNLSVKTVMSITPNSLLSQVRGYTGASYSAYAYWESLQSALSKAGL